MCLLSYQNFWFTERYMTILVRICHTENKLLISSWVKVSLNIYIMSPCPGYTATSQVAGNIPFLSSFLCLSLHWLCIDTKKSASLGSKLMQLTVICLIDKRHPVAIDDVSLRYKGKMPLFRFAVAFWIITTPLNSKYPWKFFLLLCSCRQKKISNNLGNELFLKFCNMTKHSLDI